MLQHDVVVDEAASVDGGTFDAGGFEFEEEEEEEEEKHLEGFRKGIVEGKIGGNE